MVEGIWTTRGVVPYSSGRRETTGRTRRPAALFFGASPKPGTQREEKVGGFVGRRVCALALSLGVLDARRGEPYQGPHFVREGSGDAGARAHGSRCDVRRGQILQRGQKRWHKAPDGLRGLRYGRPQRP